MWRISGPRGAQAFVFAAISSILFTVLNTLATIFATCAWVTKCCVLFPADSFRALIYYKSICLTLTENRLVGTKVHAALWLQDKKTLNWRFFGLFFLIKFQHHGQAQYALHTYIHTYIQDAGQLRTVLHWASLLLIHVAHKKDKKYLNCAQCKWTAGSLSNIISCWQRRMLCLQ